jgi:transcriptional regulator with XRE-family HTH domain
LRHRMKKYRGEKLARRRRQLNLPQEDLARAIGKSVESVSRYEHNKTEPQASTLMAIATVLKCRMEYFFSY